MDINVLFSSYDKVKAIVYSNSILLDEFQKIEPFFEQKKENIEANIMIYGVYNAGKSTLINALLKKKIAKIDDVPTTDTITKYQWEQYQIWDTPGIDAPIEHEQVTNELLKKVDAVIFVVNPSGVAEESKTLSKLVDLVRDRKQVFLIFNDKNNIGEADFIKLKNETRQRIQEIAENKGLTYILKDIPIIKINAKRALENLLKDEKDDATQRLIENSGYIDLIYKLKQFLNSISDQEIIENLKVKLETFGKLCLEKLENESSLEVIKKYDLILKNIEITKVKIRNKINEKILEAKTISYKNSKQYFKDIVTFEDKIQKLYRDNCELIFDVLESEMLDFEIKIKNEIEDLEIELNRFENPDIDFSAMDYIKKDNSSLEPQDESSQSIFSKLKNSDIDFSQMTEQATQMIKPEYIVKGLKVVKEYLPSLMKGIGPKTMEKWANAFMSKLPYVGVAISLCSSAKDLFSDDPEDIRQQKIIDEEKRQQEIFEQQLEDLAQDISTQFESSLRKSTREAIDSVFTGISLQIDSIRSQFNQKDQDNSKLIQEVTIALQQMVKI